MIWKHREWKRAQRRTRENKNQKAIFIHLYRESQKWHCVLSDQVFALYSIPFSFIPHQMPFNHTPNFIVGVAAPFIRSQITDQYSGLSFNASHSTTLLPGIRSVKIGFSTCFPQKRIYLYPHSVGANIAGFTSFIVFMACGVFQVLYWRILAEARPSFWVASRCSLRDESPCEYSVLGEFIHYNWPGWNSCCLGHFTLYIFRS